MTLKHSWCNFALEHIFLTKLGCDWLLVSGDVANGRGKDVIEEDRSIGGGRLIIKNLAVRDWYLWANEASLH